MSLNFTVQKVEEYQGLPDGEYTAQVNHIENTFNNYGNYTEVQWKILSPSAFEGNIHKERYNLESENEVVRHIAINNFSKFCIEVGGLSEGDQPKEEDFIYKIATILIKNRISKKDGRKYAGIVRMDLIDNSPKPTQQTAASNPSATLAALATQNAQAHPQVDQPFNDEVPF